MSHKLLIEAKLEKKTEFDDYLTKWEVPRGETFQIRFTITNLGDSPFQGIIKRRRVEYGGVASSEAKIEQKIESLEASKQISIGPFADKAVASGNGWLRLFIEAEDKQSIEYYQSREGEPASEWMYPLFVPDRESLQIIKLLKELKLRGGE